MHLLGEPEYEEGEEEEEEEEEERPWEDSG